jgi:hypothetical protein
MGGLWMRLGNIKGAAKAFACVSACSSFNFAKGWHFVARELDFEVTQKMI